MPERVTSTTMSRFVLVGLVRMNFSMLRLPVAFEEQGCKVPAKPLMFFRTIHP